MVRVQLMDRNTNEAVGAEKPTATDSPTETLKAMKPGRSSKKKLASGSKSWRQGKQ